MLTVCVMAKAPVAGRVKTRLSPPLTADQAASLAAGFLLDTWSVASQLDGASLFLSRAGPAGLFPPELAAVDAVDQRGSDLGARIESALLEGLERGSRVLVIGSDLPGLPLAHLEAARDALERADCVLGPSSDGGFYLIGARNFAPGTLADLPWSSPRTRASTIERLESRGFSVELAPPFDDIDEPSDLDALRARVIAAPDSAPATHRALAALDL